jgi:3-oxoacyl-[acyl-carrier-protein] synthase-3
MPLQYLDNVVVKGIAACIPKNKVSNLDYALLSLEERKKFVKTTGIEFRHIAEAEQCTSDFCYIAAKALIDELKWDKDEIDILLFVSQTADYPYPATSIILQDRLGLSKSCIAFDINLGCSGYVYGLGVISSMISSMKMKKGLLLVGETASKTTTISDKSAYPLFGDAGTATALEFTEKFRRMYFNFGCDGSGHKAILMKSGNIGGRFPVTVESLRLKKVCEGIERNDSHVALEGIDIFNFSIHEVPNSIRMLIEYNNININDIDAFIFHQANFIINDTVRKKLNIAEEKVPYTLKEFGNTSSASIPLTIVHKLRNKVINEKIKLLLCGFGVGLSWGAVVLDIEKIVCPDLIEI